MLTVLGYVALLGGRLAEDPFPVTVIDPVLVRHLRHHGIELIARFHQRRSLLRELIDLLLNRLAGVAVWAAG